MEYQKTLKTLMQTKNLTAQEMAERTKTSPRWITNILSDPDWSPWLSTILKLSEALGINAIQFVEYAEVGFRGIEPRTQNPEPRTQNPEPRTQNPEPRTQNPEPRTQNPEPRTQNPEPRTQNPEPRTQNPEPRTQNPEPRTQNPEPRTQNPEPRTQNPEPRTQNPEPRTQNLPQRRYIWHYETCVMTANFPKQT